MLLATLGNSWITEDYRKKPQAAIPYLQKALKSLDQGLFDGEIVEWVILVNPEPVLFPVDAEPDVPFLADFLDVLLQL